MKLIKPSWEIIEQKPSLEGIYDMIELAGRVCYKSTRKEGTTAKDFVDRMIASKHYAMLEHGTVYLKIRKNTYAYSHYIVVCEPDDDFMSSSYELSYRPYTKVNIQDDYIYVTTNYRVLVENDWLNDLQYLCEPTEYHEKRVAVRFTTSNGIMREFTRHRSHSFAVESTRYCNYNKDKFNNELTFVIPSWSKILECSVKVDSLMSADDLKRVSKEAETNWIQSLISAEVNYLNMIEVGYKPQEAREVLPLATKCDMVMTGFVSDWQHFFNLRTSTIAETGKPHPDAAVLADSLYKEFIKRKYLNEKF